MTSFNHYALGAVADWLHRTVAGLAPDAPGYARLRIAPRPLAALDHAGARHRTPYGEASVAWHREGDVVVVRAVVPANTTAVVALTGVDEFEIGSGAHEWQVAGDRMPAPGPLPGLHASLSDVIDDPRAYRALMDTLRAADPVRAEAVRAETRWEARRSLASALMFTPAELLERVDRAVREATAD
jgi:alpha-L-rhamnosidase